MRTCWKTRLENSGTNGAKTRIILVGRVRISITSLSGLVASVPYPFRSKMAKVELGDPVWKGAAAFLVGHGA